MKILILLAVLVVFAAGCVQQEASTYSCVSDSDCVKVDAGCCGCTAGGKATAINKNFVEQWDANLTGSCKDIVCAMVMSDDPSCFAEPKCVQGECKLMAADLTADIMGSCEGVEECPEGYVCYYSKYTFPTPEGGYIEGPQEGDLMCHKLCESDDDCEGKCTETGMTVGDAITTHKICR
ncbi:MAG: hypothetical protein ACE5J7_02715 [Candidatus Aenigmatarchaeota archaeon]